ncbi:hypothetical protein [Clostridium sp. SHJSY1]|nr:hypothetical protein [Clostridium sp. SHJSY1]
MKRNSEGETGKENLLLFCYNKRKKRDFKAITGKLNKILIL